jgi:hypothetical protein
MHALAVHCVNYLFMQDCRKQRDRLRLHQKSESCETERGGRTANATTALLCAALGAGRLRADSETAVQSWPLSCRQRSTTPLDSNGLPCCASSSIRRDTSPNEAKCRNLQKCRQTQGRRERRRRRRAASAAPCRQPLRCPPLRSSIVAVASSPTHHLNISYCGVLLTSRFASRDSGTPLTKNQIADDGTLCEMMCKRAKSENHNGIRKSTGEGSGRTYGAPGVGLGGGADNATVDLARVTSKYVNCCCCW